MKISEYITRMAPEFESKDLQKLCMQPKKAIAQADKIYKDDATSTVARVRLGNSFVVIKQHKTRSWWFALKNACRPSRAAKNWAFARRVRRAGIQTFDVMAIVEQRWGPFRGESYAIMSYVEGEEALAQFGYKQKEQANWEFVARHIVLMMKQLGEAKLSHRDLNLSNIKLVNDQPVLLDLDGMRQHILWMPGARFKDQKRFLANWTEKHYAAPGAKLLFERLCREMG